MKKALISAMLLILLICGCGSQAASQLQVQASEEVTVNVNVNETAGDTLAQSGTLDSPYVNVGEKKWDVKEEIFELERDGKKIFGVICRPVGEGKFPGIVIAHGLNCTYLNEKGAAWDFAASGMVAYVFDFIGGCEENQSDGNMLEMSVLTEAADFNVAFDAVRSLEYVDETRMFVMGESLGGYVATYIAGTRPDDVKGLIALYPAYNLSGFIYKLMLPFIPSTVNIYEYTLGRKFFEDLPKVNIYKVMANYNGKVLIFHGGKDAVVPIENSEKAVRVMKDARLVTYPEAIHGFGGTPEVMSKALELVMEIANK